jgi:hypothetical protein
MGVVLLAGNYIELTIFRGSYSTAQSLREGMSVTLSTIPLTSDPIIYSWELIRIIRWKFIAISDVKVKIKDLATLGTRIEAASKLTSAKFEVEGFGNVGSSLCHFNVPVSSMA